jgi:hypothetical protein
MPVADDEKVTMAVMSTQLDNIERLLRDHISNWSAEHEDHERRLRMLERSCAQMEQNIKTQMAILGTLTVIGSSLSAFLGVKF